MVVSKQSVFELWKALSDEEVANPVERIVSQYDGISSWRDLLRLAEDVNPPEIAPGDCWWTDVTFTHPTGWKIVIFYEAEGLDYISHFIAPDGYEIYFWEWPDDNEWKKYLINWRGVGDLQRLLSC